MKSSLLSAAVLSVCSLYAHAQKADDWILDANGIGPIKLGMTLKQAEVASGAVFHVNNANTAHAECYTVKLKGVNHVSFMITDNKIVRVNVNSQPLSTKAGAKVGDTEQQVIALYSNQLQIEPHRYELKGHYLTLSDPTYDRAIRFESDGKKITRIYSGRDNEVHFVEDCL